MRLPPTGSDGARSPRRHIAAESLPFDCLQHVARARAQGTTLNIPVGERVERALVLPVNTHNPPTPSVVEKLNAIDPAHERFSVARVVTRFVRAPDVSDTAELFGATRNFFFVESMFRKKSGSARAMKPSTSRICGMSASFLPGFAVGIKRAPG